MLKKKFLVFLFLFIGILPFMCQTSIHAQPTIHEVGTPIHNQWILKVSTVLDMARPHPNPSSAFAIILKEFGENVPRLDKKTVELFIKKTQKRPPILKIALVEHLLAIFHRQAQYDEPSSPSWAGSKECQIMPIDKCIANDYKALFDMKFQGGVCFNYTNFWTYILNALQIENFRMHIEQWPNNPKHVLNVYQGVDEDFYILDGTCPTVCHTKLTDFISKDYPCFDPQIKEKYHIVRVTPKDKTPYFKLLSSSPDVYEFLHGLHSTLPNIQNIKNPHDIKSYIKVSNRNKTITVRAVNNGDCLPDDFGNVLQNYFEGTGRDISQYVIVFDKSIKRLKFAQFWDASKISNVDLSQTSISVIPSSCFGLNTNLKIFKCPPTLTTIEPAAFLLVNSPNNQIQFLQFENTPFAQSNLYETSEKFIQDQYRIFEKTPERGIFGGQLSLVRLTEMPTLVRNYKKLCDSVRIDGQRLEIGIGMDTISRTYLQQLKCLGFNMKNIIISNSVLKVEESTFSNMNIDTLDFSRCRQGIIFKTPMYSFSACHIGTLNLNVPVYTKLKFYKSQIDNLVILPQNIERISWDTLDDNKSKISHIQNSGDILQIIQPYFEILDNGRTIKFKGNRWDSCPIKFSKLLSDVICFSVSDPLLKLLQICIPEFETIEKILIDPSFENTTIYERDANRPCHFLGKGACHGIDLTHIPPNISNIDLSALNLNKSSVRLHFPKESKVTLILKNVNQLPLLTDIYPNALTTFIFQESTQEQIDEFLMVKKLEAVPPALEVQFHTDNEGNPLDTVYERIMAASCIPHLRESAMHIKFNGEIEEKNKIFPRYLSMTGKPSLFHMCKLVDFRGQKNILLPDDYFMKFPFIPPKKGSDNPKINMQWESDKSIVHHKTYFIFDKADNLFCQYRFFKDLPEHFIVAINPDILIPIIDYCCPEIADDAPLPIKIARFCDIRNIKASFITLDEAHDVQII